MIGPFRRNFGWNFCAPLNLWGFPVFISRKIDLKQKLWKKIATKTTMLFFSNNNPKIASFTFLTIWDSLKLTYVNVDIALFLKKSKLPSDSQKFRKFISLWRISARMCITYQHILATYVAARLLQIFRSKFLPPHRKFGLIWYAMAEILNYCWKCC